MVISRIIELGETADLRFSTLGSRLRSAASVSNLSHPPTKVEKAAVARRFTRQRLHGTIARYEPLLGTQRPERREFGEV
jgi:hypothetical protein